MDELQVLDGLRVLVVDDDIDSLELLTIIFEGYNAQVTAVLSANEALEAITQTKPHILISDIAMPSEDGYSLIRKVRHQEQVSQIPAIALTALASEEARINAINAGFSTYLRKPFDCDELILLVSKLVTIAKLCISPIFI